MSGWQYTEIGRGSTQPETKTDDPCRVCRRIVDEDAELWISAWQKSVTVLYVEGDAHQIAKNLRYSWAEVQYVSLKNLHRRADYLQERQGKLLQKESIDADQSRCRVARRNIRERKKQVTNLERSSPFKGGRRKLSSSSFGRSSPLRDGRAKSRSSSNGHPPRESRKKTSNE